MVGVARSDTKTRVPVSAIARVGARHADSIIGFRCPPRDRELVRPADPLQERVGGRHDFLVQSEPLQVIGNRPRYPVDPPDRCERSGYQLDLFREPGREVAFHRRAGVHFVGSDTCLDIPSSGRGLGRVAIESGPDRTHDPRP